MEQWGNLIERKSVRMGVMNINRPMRRVLLRVSQFVHIPSVDSHTVSFEVNTDVRDTVADIPTQNIQETINRLISPNQDTQGTT